MNFISIPAVPFLIGTPERELSGLAKAYGGTRESYREESPQHRLQLPAFEIGATPVTNQEYAVYVAATGSRAPAHWRGATPPPLLREHPVVDVSWDEANAFCRWLNTTVDGGRWTVERWLRSTVHRPPPTVFRLPTEAEWEHAARGSDGRVFPWGNTWDGSLANTSEAGIATTTAVGAYPLGKSPYGCLDMCGNVWEWTASLDRPYPYVTRDGREQARAEGRRILRGGCYANPHGYARCACRFRLLPATRNPFLGFRLARSSFNKVRE